MKYYKRNILNKIPIYSSKFQAIRFVALIFFVIYSISENRDYNIANLYYFLHSIASR